MLHGEWKLRHLQERIRSFSLRAPKPEASSCKDMPSLAPALFVNHGGGPLPLMGDRGHTELVKQFESGLIREAFDKSCDWDCIIVISAHHEAEKQNEVEVYADEESPGLLFDYYGFPPETYKYKLPNPGSPKIAARVKELLETPSKGDIEPFQVRIVLKRGFDHGVFVPLLLLKVRPHIPVIQVSLVGGKPGCPMLAHRNYQLGECLKPLRKDNVLIIGSGMSFHNMQAFSHGTSRLKSVSEKFDKGLRDVIEAADKREKHITHWAQTIPFAAECHPREEHLLPLFVICGCTDEGERLIPLGGSLMGCIRYSHFIAGA